MQQETNFPTILETQKTMSSVFETRNQISRSSSSKQLSLTLFLLVISFYVRIWYISDTDMISYGIACE